MRRAATAALIAAASALALAACNGPIDISLFSEPQDDDDVVRSAILSDSINTDSVRHLADTDTHRYFAAISADGYCLIVIEDATGNSSSGCSPRLPVATGGIGPSVQLVPDNYFAHESDGWTTVTPNLLIQTD
jgi:hypothetical protein